MRALLALREDQLELHDAPVLDTEDRLGLRLGDAEIGGGGLAEGQRGKK